MKRCENCHRETRDEDASPCLECQKEGKTIMLGIAVIAIVVSSSIAILGRAVYLVLQ
tara:strand:- start:9573 stop:9743 length:171 start_codon:yes stop_codon:yes gene_type:complete